MCASIDSNDQGRVAELKLMIARGAMRSERHHFGSPVRSPRPGASRFCTHVEAEQFVSAKDISDERRESGYKWRHIGGVACCAGYLALLRAINGRLPDLDEMYEPREH
ncbi:hypothetical protein XI08_41805 [Bradyrhizobium sp. CCBAU 11361]|nr:hypothetical protein [Bradyrhizobium sp. CCBAU 11361]